MRPHYDIFFTLIVMIAMPVIKLVSSDDGSKLPYLSSSYDRFQTSTVPVLCLLDPVAFWINLSPKNNAEDEKSKRKTRICYCESDAFATAFPNAMFQMDSASFWIQLPQCFLISTAADDYTLL